MTPAARIRCAACGTEQQAPEGSAAIPCEICGAALFAGVRASDDAVAVIDLDALGPEGSPPTQRQRSAEHAQGIAELAATPTGAGNEAIEELVQLEKRIATLQALVPIWGPLRLWRSELHGDGEKLVWTAISLFLTGALAIGVIALVPSRAERVSAAHQRIESDFGTLAGLIERYREDSGAYPDAQAWASSVDRGDARFIDPWGRPYLYRLEAAEFVLETHGADGAPGGEAEAADTSRRFLIGATP